jgi:hypothetical protein
MGRTRAHYPLPMVRQAHHDIRFHISYPTSHVSHPLSLRLNTQYSIPTNQYPISRRMIPDDQPDPFYFAEQQGVITAYIAHTALQGPFAGDEVIFFAHRP